MSINRRVYNRYIAQLESVIAQAKSRPGYDASKFKWAGWNCWSAGFAAGQRSARAKRAAKRRLTE